MPATTHGETVREAISASLQLKLGSEISREGYHTQTYHVIGKGLLLMCGSRDSDVTAISIWKDVEQ
jgi:hypothetical protein